MEKKELRIVLLGKQGAGKSSTGNTLLGSKHFHTAPSSQRVTRTCSKITGTIDEQRISVVDTPAWIDFCLMEDETILEIAKCIDLTDPGPHVFLLVIPIGRFTEEEINTAQQILEVFGEEASKYTMVLFTRGDDLEEKTIEEYLEGVHPDLKKIIEVCRGRYHVFDNRDMRNHKQVSHLLKKIKHIVEENKGKYYSKYMYEKMANLVEEKWKMQNLMKAVIEEEYEKIGRNSAAGSKNYKAVIKQKSEKTHDAETGRDSVRREDRNHTPYLQHEENQSLAAKHNHKSQRCAENLEHFSKDLYEMEFEGQKKEAEQQETIERMQNSLLEEKHKLEYKIQQLQTKLDEQQDELGKVKEELQQLREEIKNLRSVKDETIFQKFLSLIKNIFFP